MTIVHSPFAGLGPTGGSASESATSIAAPWNTGGSKAAISDGVHGESVSVSSPPPDRIRILFLAANPLSTGRLAIDEEARAIAQRLRLSRDRDVFELITCWAVQPDDLLQYLNHHRPHVVHFSGHGAVAGQIQLSAGDGRTAQSVGVDALAELFRIMCDDIRVVLLNACYTAAQAQAIHQHIDFVIGTHAVISDEAAQVFAAAFYSALAFGRTIPNAFDQARTALMMHSQPGHENPELRARPDADPRLLRSEGFVRQQIELAVTTAALEDEAFGQSATAAKRAAGTSVAAGSHSRTFTGDAHVHAAGGAIAIGQVGGNVNVGGAGRDKRDPSEPGRPCR